MWWSHTGVHIPGSQQSQHFCTKQIDGAIKDMKGTKYVKFRVNSSLRSSCRSKTHLGCIIWWHEVTEIQTPLPGTGRKGERRATHHQHEWQAWHILLAEAAISVTKVWQKRARGGANLNVYCLLKDLRNECKKNTMTLDIYISVTMYNLK